MTTIEQALASIKNNRSQANAIPQTELASRRAQAQKLMAELGFDAVVMTPGASLQYFTGARWGMHERMTGMILPKTGNPVFVVPCFEEPRLQQSLAGSAMSGDVTFRAWEEDESPYALCGEVFRELGISTGKIGVEDATPFVIVDGLAKAVPQIEFVSAATVIGACRLLKSDNEIALIQHAMETTLEVQRLAASVLYEGISGQQIVDFLNDAHIAAGSDTGSTFEIVAFGSSTAFPHGPTEPQTLKVGDMVLIDTGCTYHGYHADITRTYVFGEATDRQRSIWQAESDAQHAAFAAIKVGEPCSVADDAARNVLESKGYGPDYKTPGLPHRTGHGLGMEIHEPPYMVRGNQMKFAPGMCGSIEPMLCIYGEVGVRLEDHFYVTEDGPKWFTQPSADIDRPFG